MSSPDLSPEDQYRIEAIDKMTQVEMARLMRFAKIGHPTFQTGPVHDHFMYRFTKLGGMTTAISKQIGWDG